MTLALQEMRIPFDGQVRLKEINISSNPLLNRRKKEKVFCFQLTLKKKKTNLINLINFQLGGFSMWGINYF